MHEWSRFIVHKEVLDGQTAARRLVRLSLAQSHRVLLSGAGGQAYGGVQDLRQGGIREPNGGQSRPGNVSSLLSLTAEFEVT